MPRLAERFRKIFFLFAAIGSLAAACPGLLGAQDPGQSGTADPRQEIKYSQDPNASKKMTLLLKDFDPKPMLHAVTHTVPRAKFPVVDVHNHVNDAGGIHGDEIAPEEVVRRMDQANVEKIVILNGMWGEKLQGVLDKMVN